MGSRNTLRARALGIAVLVLVAEGSARADDAACWSKRTGQPAARAGELLVSVEDGALVARTAPGQTRWRHELSALRGPVSLAADARRVVALTSEAMIAVDAAEGSPLWRRKLPEHRGTGSDLLLGIDGAHALLFRRRAGTSPKRLVVVALRTGEPVYRFKLLASGAHQVLRFADGRLAFIDGRDGDGRKRRLYYVEVALPGGKRVYDLDLTRLVAGAGGPVVAARGPDGQLFVAAGGGLRLLLGIDLARRRVVWKRRDLPALRALRWHDGALVLVSAGKVDWLEPATGETRRTRRSADPVQGLIAGPSCLLAQTPRCLRCLPPGGPSSRPVAASPAAASPPTSAPETAATSAPATPAPPTTTGRRYRDSLRGFEVRLPRGWTAMQRYARRFGPRRFSLPLVRYARMGGDWRIAASVNVLVREAVEPDVERLWQTILAHRRRQDPGLRLLDLERREQRGHAVLVADYRTGVERVRSLCLVAEGRAYELRGRAADDAGWAGVAQVMESFAPLPQSASPQ